MKEFTKNTHWDNWPDVLKTIMKDKSKKGPSRIHIKDKAELI